MSPGRTFFHRGWVRFGADAATHAWADAVRPHADALSRDPEARRDWLRHDGTWFAGVNVLGNAPDGSVDGVALAGAAIDFIRSELGLDGFDWDPAQISICYSGYPRHGTEESEAAFRYRRDRDAAHLDGLWRDRGRRRRLGETHGFILGLPLTRAGAGASPFVVYEGSHELLRTALRDRLAGIDPRRWSEEDVTEVYQATRRRIFETCPRVEIAAVPGEAYLVHRLALHGVAPWTATDSTPRAIAYFRPDIRPGETPEWWLTTP